MRCAAPSDRTLDRLMAIALEEAAGAREEAAGTLPDVPVGAVLADADGRVVSRAGNARERLADPTAHAEIRVLRSAAEQARNWRLDGLTLVVTLEPCTMCAGALVLARIRRLVYGAPDPKAGAVGSLWDVVRDRRLNWRPEVIGGVRADECAALLADFFRERRGRAGSGDPE